MYARLVIFKVGLSMRTTIEQVVDQFDPLYRAQAGFKNLFFIGDDSTGEYGSFSVWESPDAADAANAIIAPQLQQALTGKLQGAPSRWFFEVLEPKT
jgi:hypothetical protein